MEISSISSRGSDIDDREEPQTYSTLSRDQTSASGWEIEQLQILRPTTLARSKGHFLKNYDFIGPDAVPGPYTSDIRPEPAPEPRLYRPGEQLQIGRQAFGDTERQAMEPTLPFIDSGGSMDDEGDLNHLRVQVAYLEKELQKQATNMTPNEDEETKGSHVFETLYVIERSATSSSPHVDRKLQRYPTTMNPNQPEQPEMSIMTYIDEPTWLVGPNQEVILTANFPLTDPNGYLGQKKKAAFVVVKTYTPDQQVSALQKACREKRALPRPKPSYEGIRLISGGMIEAAENFFRRQQKFDTDFPNFNVRKAIGAPYLCWYFYRSEDAFSGMRPDHRRYMELLTGEMEKSCGDMYRKINSQLERQVVSPQTIEFLFRPGDVLLSKEDGKQEGFVALGQAIPKEGQQKLPGKIEDWSGRANNDDVQKNYTWTIDAWSYQYDGHFYKAEHTQATSLKIHLNVSHYEKEVPMSDLNLLPLAYAEKAFAERLAERGRIFWSCRRKKLVSYQETLDQFSSGVSTNSSYT